MTTAREFLNDLKWHQGKLEEAEVFYTHRGAPGDIASVQGRAILELRRSFFDLPGGTSIPYHRVQRVELRGQVVWDRKARSGALGRGGGGRAGPGPGSQG
jgi:hypothetical protein